MSSELPEGLDTLGLWVHEPAGEPTGKAKDYVKRVMTIASSEYSGGAEPFRRVVLLEEAHGFIPEFNIATFPQRDATAETTRFIMQARKFNLRFVIVSQRTAVVSKSALSQCENFVVLRSIDETSLTYLETIMGAAVRDLLPRLERFEAVCVGPAFNTDGPVVVRLDDPPLALGLPAAAEAAGEDPARAEELEPAPRDFRMTRWNRNRFPPSLCRNRLMKKPKQGTQPDARS